MIESDRKDDVYAGYRGKMIDENVWDYRLT